MTKDDDQNINAIWRPEHENILSDWADKAMCYRWLHQRSNSKYNRLNAWFTIPVIIISTITGTANFAQDKFSGTTREMVVVIIGSFNILAGIIQTIHQYLKIAEYNEAHRVSSISWDKFYRNIKVELAKAPSERLPVNQMLKIAQEEFDRLSETSPSIPDEIVKRFMATGKSDPTSFLEISKPEICGNLKATSHFRYIERIPFSSKITGEDTIGEKCRVVGDFIKRFTELRSRQPSVDEIFHNIGEDLSLDRKGLEGVLRQLEGREVSVSNGSNGSNGSVELSPSIPNTEVIDIDVSNG